VSAMTLIEVSNYLAFLFLLMPVVGGYAAG
jgi:hypothetical protein